jgi:hypothetical protein
MVFDDRLTETSCRWPRSAGRERLRLAEPGQAQFHARHRGGPDRARRADRRLSAWIRCSSAAFACCGWAAIPACCRALGGEMPPMGPGMPPGMAPPMGPPGMGCRPGPRRWGPGPCRRRRGCPDGRRGPARARHDASADGGAPPAPPPGWRRSGPPHAPGRGPADGPPGIASYGAPPPSRSSRRGSRARRCPSRARRRGAASAVEELGERMGQPPAPPAPAHEPEAGRVPQPIGDASGYDPTAAYAGAKGSTREMPRDTASGTARADGLDRRPDGVAVSYPPQLEAWGPAIGAGAGERWPETRGGMCSRPSARAPPSCSPSSPTA